MQLAQKEITQKIYFIRGHRVMLDSDLAELYKVETKVLNQAVRRNLDRFPDDFMFQLTNREVALLRSQIVTLKQGQHLKYAPQVFTEQGIAMLSSVLNSGRAIQVNIQIIRTFTKLRELIATNKELREKLEKMEKEYDNKFAIVFETIRKMLVIEEAPKRRIGF